MVESAILCMALNIYHEARGEPTAGQYAVAEVVLNRVKNHRWPNTICKVVNQPWQFSWTMEKTKVDDYASLHKAMMIARITTSGYYKPKWKSTHYHTTAIKPGWSNFMEVQTVIGNHIFYVGE